MERLNCSIKQVVYSLMTIDVKIILQKQLGREDVKYKTKTEIRNKSEPV